MNKLLKHFPFKTIRTAQENILNKIEPHLDDPNIKYIIIEAGTGVGKSAIAKTLSEYYGNSYLLTATKSLQEQYKDEFYNFSVKVAKGKANYQCIVDGDLTCDKGVCKTNKSVFNQCNNGEHISCPYFQALNAAKSSEMFVSSYAFFLSYREGDKIGLPARDLIVIDECHLLDDHLIELAKFKLDMDKMEKMYHLSEGDIEFSDVVKWRKKFKPNDDKNNLDVLQIIIERLTKKITKNTKKIFEYGQLESNKQFLSAEQLSEFEKIDVLALDSENNDIKRLISKIEKYRDTMNNGNWVTAIKEDGRGFFAVPISSKELFEKYIGKTARKKIVFMSATIFGKKNFCDELGLDPEKTLYIQETSAFDPKRSPIIIHPCLSFRQGEYEQSIPSAAKEVTNIINFFKSSKGIIHTGNYKVANFLTYHIKSRRFIYRMNNESNEDLIMRHTSNRKNTILVSPSMMNGVDLKDDFSRFQIIMKLPYLSLQDPRIKYISQHNFSMYAVKMLREFMQACGRSTRSENDWSVTYVLDKAFVRIFNQYKHLIPSLTKRMISYDDFDIKEYINYIKK